MSDQPETLAAIIADYRADIPAMTSRELPHPTPEYLRILLDRIEAAAKRERDAAAVHAGRARAVEEAQSEANRRADRLADIVRRLADLSESLLANYEYRYREDVNSMAFVENTSGFLREARAAIGEGAQ